MQLAALFGATVVAGISRWERWIEVNHFPSQTMAEVLCMFSFSLLVSLIALHFALGLKRIGPGWQIIGDSMFFLTLLGSFAVNVYSSTLSTAQRDLPPALQSYWFPPHLSALIFSYGTLGIAGLICLVYFAMRFWNLAVSDGVAGGWKSGLALLGLASITFGLGAHSERWTLPTFLIGLALLGAYAFLVRGKLGGKGLAPHLLLLFGLSLVPFAHFVTVPVLLLVGLVFLTLRAKKLLPSIDTLVGMERQMDEVSYRAFSVGFPFLTAGLFMGAFWAQEAWANYWGWDSKENSALITWLIYVVYIHLRMLGGYRGQKAMAVLMGGALAVFITFQAFGYLPDSQKSLHRYTDDGVVPQEGMQGAAPASEEAARLDE